MARPGITAEQVAKAADAIKARGQEPTLAAVRAEIGSGSYTTVGQHLAAWRQAAHAPVEAPPVPADVEEAGMAAVATIWSHARRAADEETAAIRREAHDAAKRCADELAEAVAEIARLEDRIADLDEQLVDAKRDTGTALELQREAERDIVASRSALQQLQSAYDALVAAVGTPPAAKASSAVAEPKAARRIARATKPA